MISRLKKIKQAWLSETDSKRKFAITYVEGQIYTGYTHFDCVNQYKLDNNDKRSDNELKIAFAYMAEDNNIYLADDCLFNYNESDLSNIAQAIKQEFPNSNIYYDSTEHFDTELNDEHEQIARLKKVSEDSSNVMPNGVVWNDDIWDTYENNNKVQKSTINREWTFEKEIDNPEWIMQQN